MSASEELANAWRQYTDAEGRGLRADALALLTSFVERVSTVDPAERDTWVRWYLERKVDDEESLPLRSPLFRQVLWPFLHRRYSTGDADAARWLAALAQDLFRCRDCWESLGWPGEIDLWNEAFRRRPDDRTRRTLISLLANGIRYTLHELPAGVLYGANGATIEECDLLENELAEFRALLRESELADFREMIGLAAFHYRTYREYLAEGSRSGYAKFLASRSGS